MSNYYSIATTIDQAHSTENIRGILEKGKNLGFTYFQFILAQTEFEKPLSSMEKVLESALKQNEETRLNSIVANIEDTYITIDFSTYGTRIVIYFSDFTYPWLKTFEDGNKDLDINRYAKVMLDLVEDYKILEMKIEKD